MNIELAKKTMWSDLEQQLRTVPLLHARAPDGSKIFPYQSALISLRTLSPDEINPTTFYVLEGNLAQQRALRDELLRREGIDTLVLDGSIEIANNDAHEVWTMIPPIVELSEEDVCYQSTRGDLTYEQSRRVKIPLLNDGVHRVMLARELGRPISAVVISGTPYEHPFYAYPNSWSDVKIVEKVPPTMGEKKLYRRKNSYDLYRDFGVLGCGKPRYTGGQSSC